MRRLPVRALLLIVPALLFVLVSLRDAPRPVYADTITFTGAQTVDFQVPSNVTHITFDLSGAQGGGGGSFSPGVGGAGHNPGSAGSLGQGGAPAGTLNGGAGGSNGGATGSGRTGGGGGGGGYYGGGGGDTSGACGAGGGGGSGFGPAGTAFQTG